MKHRVVNATEVKTECLAQLDGVAERGGAITVTKRGRPLAEVGPARQPAWKSPEGAWVGKVTLAGDLLEADTAELWEVPGPDPVARS
jgi:antitoxin (DNA-binding transcriptional repressor) of toxin-antitoxin stability system